jgi:hypothetical protein
MIEVAGAVYLERCLQPKWNYLFGSGGRAAIALGARDDVRLHTYVEPALIQQVEARVLSSGRAELLPTPIATTVGFHYVHPLSVPIIVPAPHLLKQAAPLQVAGEIVLRFGMMEGDAVVKGARVVYDPQSATSPAYFTANGSEADELAVVANGYEVKLLTGVEDPGVGAQMIRDRDHADVVVVKLGARGALVVTEGAEHVVPAYKTKLVFSIGSGDIFAAAFTHFWAVERRDAAEAADLASRSAAHYCASRSAELLGAVDLAALPLAPVTPNGGRVYLAGPFFSLAQRWLVEETRARLLELQLEVFSPLHDVGRGPAETVGPADLAGLDACDRVLALLDGRDPGTLIEVGYARARGLPVVAFSESVNEEDLKMVIGSGCEHTDDFATAVYLTAWGA